MNIIIWLISGTIAGWLTGLIMKGGGYGLIGDLVVGLLGGFVGGFLAGKLGLEPASWIGQILVAVAGGVILVAFLRFLDAFSCNTVLDKKHDGIRNVF